MSSGENGLSRLADASGLCSAHALLFLDLFCLLLFDSHLLGLRSLFLREL